MHWKHRDFSETLKKSAFAALLLPFFLCGMTGPVLADVDPERSHAYYEAALEHLDKGTLRSAVIELKNALQRDPQNADARLLLGKVYVRLGDGAAAEKELRAARRYGIAMEHIAVDLGRAMLLQRHYQDVLETLDPAAYTPQLAPELELQRAQALAGLGRLAEARDSFERTLREHPEEAGAHLGLASLDLRAGRFDAAEAHAVAALAQAPDLTEATLVRAEARRLKGEPESALSLYRGVIETSQLPTAVQVRAHLGLAAALVALARDMEAEAELSQLQSLAPGIPLAAYLRALIKVRNRDFRDARRILDAASPSLESYGPAQFLFGVVYFAAEELETARTWFSRHLKAHPQNLQARKLLAATLLRLNAVADAVELLEKAPSQASADPQALMLLGTAYVRSGRAAEATKLLQEAVDLAPDDPRVLGQLAISHFATGEYDESVATVIGSLDLNSDISTLGYALAFAHLQAGAFGEALQIAQELRARYPESAMAANLEGAAYAARGQLEQAQASFEAVLAISPEFHRARANLAALKASIGDTAGAEAEYQTILEQDAHNVDAMLGLAALASRRGDRSAHRDWLDKAVEANPDSPRASLALAESYVQSGELTPALEVLSAVDRRKPDIARVLTVLARLQTRAGQFDKAIGIYHRLVKISGGSADARMLLAKAQLAAGEVQKAREELEATLTAFPNHQPTVEALLEVVTQREGSEAALAFAQQLQQRYPSVQWSGQLVGDVHSRAGHREEAIAAYEEGWVKRPSAGLAVALSKARLSQNEERKALMPLQQWLEKHSGDDRVRMVLAESLLRLGRLEEARSEYETLMETQAANPLIWNNLAWLYQQAEDPRAVASAERALALAPNQPAIMDTLGWILLEAGQIARARDLLQLARQQAPDSPDIAYHYAVALHKGGDNSAAREILQSLLDSERSFAAKADAAALLAQISQQHQGR